MCRITVEEPPSGRRQPWKDADNFLCFAVFPVMDDASRSGKQRIVTADAHIISRLKSCSPLTNQDAACSDQFAPESLHAEKRCELLSRPLRELPTPFLCAIKRLPYLSILVICISVYPCL